MRMIQAITQLRFSDALRYNALGLAFVVVLVWTWGAWLAQTLGKKTPNPLHHRLAPQAVLVLVTLWFIIRLLPFEPFVSLQV